MNTCHNEFKKGARERLERPLPYGVYKLKEAAERLESRAKGVREIADYHARGEKLPDMLRHCARHEVKQWLKDGLLDVSYRIGHDILPGIEALKSDAVTVHTVENIRQKYKPQLQDILIKGEATLQSEKAADTAHLLEQTVETIDSILKDVGHPRKSGYR